MSVYGALMAAATGAAVWVTFRVAGDFRAAVGAMGQFHAGWLGLAGAVEVAGLIFAGEALWRLQGRPSVISRPVAQAASLVNLSLGPLMPAAPVEGWTLSFFELRRRGLPQRRAGLALAWGLWMQARAFVLLGACSAIAVLGFGELHGNVALFAWLGVGGGILYLAGTWFLTNRPRPLAAIGAAFAWALPLKMKPEEVRAAVRDFHAEAHELLGRGHRRQLAWLLVAIGPLTTGLALWLILEAGTHPISVEEALMAAALAIVASWVPFIPGGIGIAESTLTVVLHHFGVPLPEGLAVALVWRGITLVGPAVTGVLALGTLRLRRHPKLPPLELDS